MYGRVTSRPPHRASSGSQSFGISEVPCPSPSSARCAYHFICAVPSILLPVFPGALLRFQRRQTGQHGINANATMMPFEGRRVVGGAPDRWEHSPPPHHFLLLVPEWYLGLHGRLHV